MRISIITVTYNAERFLERTLASIDQQTRRADLEHVIVDGGSTDGTPGIIQRHAGAVDRWVSGPDAGIYDAMNKGMELATGDFVWFVNAGDTLYDPTAAARVLDALSGGADVAWGDTMLVDEAGGESGLRSRETPHALPHVLTWRSLARGLAVGHQSIVVRRSLAPPYNHRRHYYSADVDWMIRVLKAARTTVAVAGPLTRFLLGGFSKQHHLKSLLDRFAVLRSHFGLPLTLWNHAAILGRAVRFRMRPR